MHLGPASVMILLSIVVIGIFSRPLNAKASERNPAHLELAPEEEGRYIVVEPSHLSLQTSDNKSAMVPYRERRTKWGVQVSVGAGTYEPAFYEPDQTEANFSDVYDDSPQVPMVDLSLLIKRNFWIGSVGVELGAGYYEIESNGELVDSTLTLVPLRLGARITLDALFPEPRVAPYVAGGGYLMFFEEKQSSVTFDGNSSFAGYFAAGLLFQMNWLDSESARVSYVESGIENTYLFLEGRKFLASSVERDPDFETEFNVNAGFQLEF